MISLSKSWRRLLVLVVVVIAAGLACTYLKEAIGLGPVKPKVNLQEIQITAISLTSLDLAVILRVDNPNDEELKLSRLRYKVAAIGHQIAEGTRDEPVLISAKGSTTVRLPLSVDAENALKLISRVLKGGHPVEALVTATADFDTPFGDMEVSFKETHPLGKVKGF